MHHVQMLKFVSVKLKHLLIVYNVMYLNVKVMKSVLNQCCICGQNCSQQMLLAQLGQVV
jgi:hypothetical protein